MWEIARSALRHETNKGQNQDLNSDAYLKTQTQIELYMLSIHLLKTDNIENTK